MTLRTLLLVTYHFPPSAASGSFRLLGFARHLLPRGWRTVVVAPPSMPYESVDEELGRKVPPETAVYPAPFPKGNRLTRRFVPDSIWFPGAWKACRRALAAEKPEAVLTSSPPHAVHVLGRLLKSRYGLPWVVDFRDPWTYGHGRPRQRNWVAHGEAIKEKIVLRAADAIIVNTPRARAALANDLPAFAAKMHVIPNGYDPESFPLEETPRTSPTALSIVHTGEIYAGRDPRPFFDALLGMQLPPGTPPLQVTFLGNSTDPRHDWPKEVQSRGLENVIHFAGRVDYAQALKVMQNADILLLLDGVDRRVGIPAKLYEYFGARRPILALAKEGDISWALAKSGVCYRLAHPANPAQIRQALTELLSTAADNSNANQPVSEDFTRSRLAGQLAGVLDKLPK
jgi:glycosyltransferase involved in cell wall biosynthesis